MSRARSFLVACSIVSVAAAGTAHAETQANVSPSCDYGQVASAKFKENATNGAWEYWAGYTTHHWYGNTTGETAHKLFAAARGTYAIRVTPQAGTKVDSIHVRSSGSVEGAAGEQCIDAGGDFMQLDCDESCDTVLSVVADLGGAVEVPAPDPLCLECVG